MSLSPTSQRPGKLAVALLTATTATLLPGPVGGGPVKAGQSGSCGEPYAPVYGYHAAPSAGPVTQTWPEAPVEQPAFGTSPFDHQQQMVDAGFDADGDGRNDAAFTEHVDGVDVLVVARGDGEVRIGLAGHSLGSLQGFPVGDLDADSRDEILFLARPVEGGPDRNFVLPGTTAPGTYRADEVGIAVPQHQVMPVGDRVDGPGDDLAVPLAGSTPGTAIVSGDAVMGAGAGGTAAFEPSGDSLEGFPVGVFDLDDGEITVVTITEGTVGPSPVTLAVHRPGRVVLFASPPALPLSQPPYRVRIVPDAGRRFLVADHSDRGGSQGYYWDIDEPCRQLPGRELEEPANPSPVPRPPAARPVPGSATFTG